MKQNEGALSKKIVVNDLLCFVQNNFKELNPSSICRLCQETYMPEEISKSFHELKNHVMSLEPTFNIQPSDNSKMETLKAIVHFFNSKACDLIQFVSSNCNMPRMGIYRDMLSVTCVLDELKELKQLVKSQTELLNKGFYRLSNEVEKLKKDKEFRQNDTTHKDKERNISSSFENLLSSLSHSTETDERTFNNMPDGNSVNDTDDVLVSQSLQLTNRGKERNISSSIENLLSNLSRSTETNERTFNNMPDVNCVNDTDDVSVSQSLEVTNRGNNHQVKSLALRGGLLKNSSLTTLAMLTKTRRRSQNMNNTKSDSFRPSLNRLSSSGKLYKKHSCKLCGYVGNLTDVTRHMRTHTGERPYSCPLCSTRFTLRGNMIKHLARKHGTFLSRFPPGTKSSKVSFRKPEKPLKSIPSKNSSSLPTGSFMPLTFPEQHSSDNEIEVKQADDIPLNISLTLPELPDIKTEGIIDEYPASSFALDLNPQDDDTGLTTSSFTASSMMNEISTASSAVATYNPMLHMQSSQQDSAPAASVQALDRFVSNQIQKKRHRCEICGYTSNASDVTRHKRTHTGERPYPCPVCDARFSLRGNMTKHLTRMHPDFQSKTKF